MEQKKGLTGKEKFAYGIGAVGKDMVYMLSASYVLYYFQDIMGVSAVAMGVILMIARVFDAFNDPLMGVIVAKTKTRFGKFRPWLFIGTLTNAIILFLMFSAPPTLNAGGLVAYAAVTYILWGVTYTMMDIPYWSMVPAFTSGGKERENLSAMARTCAGVGSAIVTVITVMAVAALGGMASKNSKNNQNMAMGTDFNNTVYVVEQDANGVATGNVLTYENANSTINVTASDKVFNHAFTLTGDNADYTITLNGQALDNTNSTISLVCDSIDDKKIATAIYVNEEIYKAVTADTATIQANFTSKNEIERLGFKYFALGISVLFIVFTLITCIFIKEKSTVDVKSASVKDMFKALVQNDQAMAMVITIVLVNSATYITSNLLIYFFKYDLAGSNWQGDYTIFNTFGGAVQILSMMALFPLLRKFFNTMKIFYISIFSAIGGYIILLVMALGGISSVFPFLVPGFFIMAAVGIMNVLVTVFLANTVDYGELKNKRRDESVIFSMQTFVVKLASGIAALIASLCLEVFDITSTTAAVKGSLLDNLKLQIGNIQNHVVDSISGSSVVGLRLVMTLVPIVVLGIAVLIFKKKYILTDAKLAEISAELKG